MSAGAQRTGLWNRSSGEFWYSPLGSLSSEVSMLPSGRVEHESYYYGDRQHPVRANVYGFADEEYYEYLSPDDFNQLRYRYSGAGWRIRKEVGTSVTRTAREGARALGDFEAGGIVRHWNLSGGLGRLGISGSTERSALRYYFSDHLGSLLAVATSAGTVVEARDPYAFGLEIPGRAFTPSIKTREGYTGHQLDGETGFNYAGARYSTTPRYATSRNLANR